MTLEEFFEGFDESRRIILSGSQGELYRVTYRREYLLPVYGELRDHWRSCA